MKTIPAGQFKAVCLRVMDEVNKTREPITITKKGKPVAKLMPADTPTKDVFGCMRGRLEILGDIVAPAVPTEDWESLV
jgi:prevent-host-death family protein